MSQYTHEDRTHEARGENLHIFLKHSSFDAYMLHTTHMLWYHHGFTVSGKPVDYNWFFVYQRTTINMQVNSVHYIQLVLETWVPHSKCLLQFCMCQLLAPTLSGGWLAVWLLVSFLVLLNYVLRCGTVSFTGTTVGSFIPWQHSRSIKSVSHSLQVIFQATVASSIIYIISFIRTFS